MNFLQQYWENFRKTRLRAIGDKGRRPDLANEFALGDGGVGPFLLSAVGRDASGSDLTALSMLARIGKDPWATASTWANGSKSVAIEELSADIATMPLDSVSLENGRKTAATLVELLPRKGPADAPGARGRPARPSGVSNPR